MATAGFRAAGGPGRRIIGFVIGIPIVFAISFFILLVIIPVIPAVILFGRPERNPRGTVVS